MAQVAKATQTDHSGNRSTGFVYSPVDDERVNFVGELPQFAIFTTTSERCAQNRWRSTRFGLAADQLAGADSLVAGSADLLDILITEMFSGAARAGDKARLRTIKDLDADAIQLTQVCRLVLDAELQDAELRSAIFKAL
jgi:gamma-glutamyl:cysteine ligase YbdK (ATP-grasp superfamily)